jgi:choline-sulfatase
MVVSMTHPHDPYAITQEYWDRYRHEDIDMPRVRLDDAAMDPHSRRLRHVCGLDAQPVTDTQVRAARHAYYGAVSYVDDHIGALLADLKSAGFDRDTVVIVLADHGDMLGERGLWYKMSFFERAARVPLMVYAPGMFRARSVPQSVSLIDLLPTLMELAADGAGAQPVTEIEGRSLLPQLAGSPGHDEVLGEYLAEGAIAPVVMIRTGRHKFVHSPTDPDQLFDVVADPDELDNLATQETDTRAASLRRQVQKTWALDSIHAAVLASQRRRHLVDRALQRGRRTAWDWQPPMDASREYVRNTKSLEELEASARFPRV